MWWAWNQVDGRDKQNKQETTQTSATMLAAPLPILPGGMYSGVPHSVWRMWCGGGAWMDHPKSQILTTCCGPPAAPPLASLLLGSYARRRFSGCVVVCGLVALCDGCV